MGFFDDVKLPSAKEESGNTAENTANTNAAENETYEDVTTASAEESMENMLDPEGMNLPDKEESLPDEATEKEPEKKEEPVPQAQEIKETAEEIPAEEAILIDNEEPETKIEVFGNQSAGTTTPSHGTASFLGPDCIIEGNIKNTGDMIIAGTINGNAEISGHVVLEKTGTVKENLCVDGPLTIEGNVGGKIDADEINIANHSKIHGNIKTAHLAVDNGCVVIGNIACDSIDINGAIKGDIDVKGNVNLKENAIVKGNIKASSLNILPGAVLDGSCTLSNTRLDYKKIFGE